MRKRDFISMFIAYGKYTQENLEFEPGSIYIDGIEVHYGVNGFLWVDFAYTCFGKRFTHRAYMGKDFKESLERAYDHMLSDIRQNSSLTKR